MLAKTPEPFCENPQVEINRRLLRATIRLNTLLFAAVFGLICGLGLFVITFISLNRGLPNPGHYLNLLGVFFQGYRVSPGGAWIGLLWGGAVGAISGAVIYRIYAQTIEQQLHNYLNNENSDHEFTQPTLLIAGHPLGLALGTVMALGLFLTTGWLVIRGTADQSPHAALLSNYLPGYTVSFSGGLIGAALLFAITYFFCRLLGWIYNRVVLLRSRGKHR